MLGASANLESQDTTAYQAKLAAYYLQSRYESERNLEAINARVTYLQDQEARLREKLRLYGVLRDKEQTYLTALPERISKLNQDAEVKKKEAKQWDEKAQLVLSRLPQDTVVVLNKQFRLLPENKN